MDKKLIGLLVAAAIGLSACGSTGAVRDGKAEGHALGTGGTGSSSSSSNSSGASSSSSNADASATNTNQNPTPPTPVFTGAGRSLTSLSGLDVNGENVTPSPNYLAPTTEAEINVLQVEGRNITLVPSGATTADGWYESRDTALYNGGTAAGSWAMVNAELNHAKFGEVYDSEEKRFRFAQGNTTPETAMPTSGKVKYTGKSTYSMAGGSSTPVVKGLSEFTVDFGEKTIDGAIKPANVGDFEQVDLKAVIKGNTIEGYNTRNSGSTQAVARGSFYGPNAEEMAGTYHFSADGTTGDTDTAIDGRKPMGTFGASKQ